MNLLFILQKSLHSTSSGCEASGKKIPSTYRKRESNNMIPHEKKRKPSHREREKEKMYDFWFVRKTNRTKPTNNRQQEILYRFAFLLFLIAVIVDAVAAAVVATVRWHSSLSLFHVFSSFSATMNDSRSYHCLPPISAIMLTLFSENNCYS